MTYRIFISSVQREFTKERKALADYIRKELLIGTSVNLLCFEQPTARGRLPDFVPMRQMHGVEIKL